MISSYSVFREFKFKQSEPNMPPKINPDTRAHDNILALYTYLQANTQPISLTMLTDKYRVSKATMLRYLQSLENSGYGKVKVEKNGREHYYSLTRPDKMPALALSVEGLQQLALCRDFITHLLPPAIQKSIEIALNQATAYLPTDSSNPLQGLPTVASSFTRGKIDYSKHQDVLKNLLTAIRDKAVCVVTYKNPRGEQIFDYAPKEVIALNEAVHINGWKVTDKGRVETLKEHPNNLLLHRIKNVELTIRTSENIPEIDEHDDGYFGFMNDGEAFDAVIRFYGSASNYVGERIWSSEQEITQIDDNCIEITLAVQSEWELKSWILGFGENAEVVSPDWLKDEILETAQKIAEKYK